MTTLRQIIEQHLPSSARTNHKGWCNVVCRICNDHGNKGARAAFRWNGDAVGYNCFNCNHATKFDPDTDDHMPPKMIELFKAYDIPDIDWLPFVKHNKEQAKQQSQQYFSIVPSTIVLPSSFYQIQDDNSDWNSYAIEYLHNRNIDWKSQPFYLADKHNKQWYGRIIVPVFHNNNLIYYFGRDLTDKHKLKYKNADTSDSSVLFGYHNINHQSNEPIYICEGWFDAYPINGVAIFKNKLSENHIKWLNRSNRRKVVIPDQYGNGQQLAQQAISLGWDISFPFIDSDVSDVSTGISKYGLLWVLKSIRENTKTGFDAQLNIQIYCK